MSPEPLSLGQPEPGAAGGANLDVLSAPLEVVFNRDYGLDRGDLLLLYEKAKRDQWNASVALDWSRPVDVDAGILEDERISIYGTTLWDKLDRKRRAQLNFCHSAWALSQFMHGEQGALLTASEIVASIPWTEAKFYAASQVMDEGRHVEAYSKYLKLKLGKVYPITPSLQQLLASILTDSRWYWKLVGMQLIVESLALAAFKGMIRNAKDPLIKDVVKYVMADESRHVGFGVLALREFIRQLPEAPREELAEFAYEACGVMARGFFATEVYEEVGFTARDFDQLKEAVRQSPARREFLAQLWTVLVPNLKQVGLITARLRPKYESVGLDKYEDLPVIGESPSQ